MTELHLDPSRLDELTHLFRFALLSIGIYLVVVTLLNIWARRSRSQSVKRFVSAASPKVIGIAVAWLVATAGPAGAQTPSQAMTGSLSGSTSGAGGSAPIMELIETPSMTLFPWLERSAPDTATPTTTTTTSTTTPPPASSETASVAIIDSELVPSTSVPESGESTSATAQPRGTTEIHVVSPGESFWSIARSTLVQQTGHDPDTATLTRYWLDLVALNSDRLVVPNNPDVIFPGQELLLEPQI